MQDSSNTVVVGNVTVSIKRGPFGNKFVANDARIERYRGQKELHFFAMCTADSLEPGRVYSCIYTLNGNLIACTTVN